VNPASFTSTAFGEPYRDPTTGWGYWAFRPRPIPRELDLDAETVLALSSADAALGRLVGAGRQLPDPHVFVRPYVTREALASSRIEGTVASLSDVLQAEATPESPATGDVREVLNYMAAMDRGLTHLPDLPLVHRMVTDIHSVLLQDVRGRSRAPGRFRKEPVWIGSPPTDSPEASVYVPPFPAEMLEAWRDWEEFANAATQPRLPKLVQCALLHYQFETIHPFLDGNGRIGRLLIVLFLLHRAFLPAPLLYISSYLEEFRRDYYERLQGVRERGEMQEWLQFFFAAVATQAEDATARAERLVDLRERYRGDLAGSRSRATEVVDLIFANPFVTARRVQTALDISNQGAHSLLKQLEKRTWLESYGTFGRGGRAYWVAPEIYEVVSDPTPARLENEFEREVTLSAEA
jgi:cell filamentation protein, protein adenylyltransferase